MSKPHLKISAEADTVKMLAYQLKRDSTDIVKRLTHAAIIGETLNQYPRRHASRVTAKSAWKAIRGILNPNLTTEPRPRWEPAARELPGDLVPELEAQLQAIRHLVIAVASVDFEFDSDARIREAGRALKELVVVLDDIIADRRQGLLPDLDGLIFDCDSIKQPPKV